MAEYFGNYIDDFTASGFSGLLVGWNKSALKIFQRGPQHAYNEDATVPALCR